ncbi:MAG: hypothetical protein ABW201_18540 [Candidatus Thiodiazotropha sp.]
MKSPHLKSSLFLLLLFGITGASVWFALQNTGNSSEKSGNMRMQLRRYRWRLYLSIVALSSYIVHLPVRWRHNGFGVAPEMSGRNEQLNMDLADSVVRGQLIAELDNTEYRQVVGRTVIGGPAASTKITLVLISVVYSPFLPGTRSDINMNAHLLFKALTNPKYSYKVSDYVCTV